MDKRKRRLLCMLEGSGQKSRWISGAPPLSFKAKKAGTLENYRIYGNTVGGESVGDLVESGEHAGEYEVSVTVSNGTDTLTTPIYLPEPIKMVGDEAEYIDYVEQKQHRVRKNLLQNTATSTTRNGVTFTANSDGSVTCNGTADKAAWFDINRTFDVYSPDGRIASIGNQGSLDTFYMNIGVSGIGAVINSYKYSKTTHNNVWIHIVIASGYACDNLTLYPMIRKADIEDDTYEPYIVNTDLDVTLPALPTLPGTNVLSVGTAVQPSRVEVKGRIKAVGQETEPEPEAAEAEQE